MNSAVRWRFFDMQPLEHWWKYLDTKTFFSVDYFSLDYAVNKANGAFFTKEKHPIWSRLQMYYTYRKARSLSPSIDVHLQPMKTFRSLFQVHFPLNECFFKSFSSDEDLSDLCVFYQRRAHSSTVILDISSFNYDVQLAMDDETLFHTFISNEINSRTMDDPFSWVCGLLFVQFQSNWSRSCESNDGQ